MVKSSYRIAPGSIVKDSFKDSIQGPKDSFGTDSDYNVRKSSVAEGEPLMDSNRLSIQRAEETAGRNSRRDRSISYNQQLPTRETQVPRPVKPIEEVNEDSDEE